MWICRKITGRNSGNPWFSFWRKVINWDSLEISQFDEDAVLEAIKETSDNSDDNFSFEFDDDDELVVEDDSVDLATEMMESKIQKAAGMVLINSKNDVSDIHIEPEKKVTKSELGKMV